MYVFKELVYHTDYTNNYKMDKPIFDIQKCSASQET